MKTYRITILAMMTLLLSGTACERYVEVEPSPTLLASDKVFSSDAVASSAMTGIYSNANASDVFAAGSGTITLPTGMSADELQYFPTTDYTPFVDNTLLSNNTYVLSLWLSSYRYIYQANVIREGLPTATAVTPATKNQLMGEATFLRAFFHFYLTNLFGDVPLITSTDYKVNAMLPRTAQATVYQAIIKDLLEAESSMPATYVTAGDKGRPNKWTATALLARTYLYAQDWANAETKATSLIGSGTYSLVPDLNGVFLKNSTEAIWQVAPVTPNRNTYLGSLILPATTGTITPLYIYRDDVPGAFEPADKRKSAWINTITYQGKTYYYPFKYKVKSSATVTEYQTMFRLAEQYLIRAEARTQQGNLAGAIADLNTIRSRAGLTVLPTTLDKAGVLLAIEQERRVELIAEMGHRWFDLKRTNRADAVLGPKKPNWKPTAVLYPVPQAEWLANPTLTQNPGYTY